MRLHTARTGLLLAFSTLACGTESPPDPQALFNGFEERLVSASEVEVAFEVGAEGAVSAALEGELWISSDSVNLTAFGFFAGESVVLRLAAGTDRMSFGAGGAMNSSDRPAFLQEALAIGLTRMGILHNLARLTAGAPPDRADGGVRDWVTVHDLGLVEADDFILEEGDARASDMIPVAFGMTVDGTPAGAALLGFTADKLPFERRQTVRFPSGTMRVIERYTRVTIHP